MKDRASERDMPAGAGGLGSTAGRTVRGADASGAAVIVAGGCSVWALPQDTTIAAVARGKVRETLRALLIPEEMVGDAATMVSELATNVLVHVLRDRCRPPGQPELWMYRRGKAPQIVTKVFDDGPWKGAVPHQPLRPPPGAEGGRGLELVNGLTGEHGGEWGVHRTRSRLGCPPGCGKAVYFALPAPEDSPASLPLIRRGCREASRDLEAALRARGLGPLHRSEGWDMSVLSVRAGVTVWARDGGLAVTTPAGMLRFPPGDVTEAAETIVCHCEDLDAR
ncbi:ATP-binding protein [Actinomadura keratinilytica]|uniref:Histidine kinase/HSP90-like ATPase domain-containing protein n=1 Tax=Actinomadura keratinilytica TaxID=547461 RepID=A0ABP7YUD1_9ACTN